MFNLPNPNDPPSSSELGHVDMIREIIFGGQMRDYEGRFKAHEEELRRRAEAISEEGTKSLAAVTAELKREQTERAGQHEALVGELRGLTQTLERNLTQLREEAERLRRETAEQAKALREEARADLRQFSGLIERELADLRQFSGLIERELAELRSAKTDRAALGRLLAELGERLAAPEPAPKGP